MHLDGYKLNSPGVCVRERERSFYTREKDKKKGTSSVDLCAVNFSILFPFFISVIWYLIAVATWIMDVTI